MSDRPEPEPVTWCRLFAVGPVCPKPCGECKASNARLTDDQRRRLTQRTPT